MNSVYEAIKQYWKLTHDQTLWAIAGIGFVVASIIALVL
jgi:hypothetical protein